MSFPLRSNYFQDTKMAVEVANFVFPSICRFLLLTYYRLAYRYEIK